jgi:hypothetical protein
LYGEQHEANGTIRDDVHRTLLPVSVEVDCLPHAHWQKDVLDSQSLVKRIEIDILELFKKRFGVELMIIEK